MAGFESFELLFGGGLLMMALAGLLLAAQTILFVAKRNSIHRKMDEEYGQPQKYNMKGEGN